MTFEQAKKKLRTTLLTIYFTIETLSFEGLTIDQSVTFRLCHIINGQWITHFSGTDPDEAFSVLNLAVLSESDAWAIPPSEPDSSMTRPFPTGSKFDSFL